MHPEKKMSYTALHLQLTHVHPKAHACSRNAPHPLPHTHTLLTHKTDIWVEHVVKNPQYKGVGAATAAAAAGAAGGGGGAAAYQQQQQQLPPLFEQKLEDYITALPGFK